MNFKNQNNDRYVEYLEDIKIAQKEIKDIKLYPSEPIICDMYVIPSHNFQAYYAMIYKHNGRLEMVYAKPQIYSFQCLNPIKMYTFLTTKEAEKKSGFDGRIVIGIKRLPDEFISLLNCIIMNLPDDHVLGENLIMIDGTFQAIRVFENGNVIKEIVYQADDVIPFIGNKEILTKKLDDLYLLVRNIIDDELNPD